MCIALVATSHPNYALIIIDNRDEYILRPTSRPQWWTHSQSGHQVLSARDLLRRERGTWMGVTKQGRLALLTNYRETIGDQDHPVRGVKSRGAMVTAWLGAPAQETLEDFVKKMLEGRMVKGVGGFSLICGDLRRTGETEIKPLVVISNRSEAVDGVPWVGGERGKVWGLSNTAYTEHATWPKVVNGKKLLEEAIQRAVEKDCSKDELVAILFSVLDTDTFPGKPGMKFEDILQGLRQSIFIPAFGDDARTKETAEAVEKGKLKAAFEEVEDESREMQEQGEESPAIFNSGLYGTQRQTIILVDWDGNVTYKERAFWDAHGNPIERGNGDVTFRFTVDEWHSSSL